MSSINSPHPAIGAGNFYSVTPRLDWRWKTVHSSSLPLYYSLAAFLLPLSSYLGEKLFPPFSTLGQRLFRHNRLHLLLSFCFSSLSLSSLLLPLSLPLFSSSGSGIFYRLNDDRCLACRGKGETPKKRRKFHASNCNT